MKRELVIAALVVVGVFLFSGIFNLTGFAITGDAINVNDVYVENASGVVGGNVTQGDNFTVYANITTTDGEEVTSVWVSFWSRILGWFGADEGLEYNLTETETADVYEVVLSSDSPPFPSVTDFENFNFTVEATGDMGNYSNRTGSVIISESKIELNEGWNMIAFTMHNQSGEGQDVNIILEHGWNLIGYSSSKGSLHQEDVYIDGVNMTTAVRNGTIQNQFTFFDSNDSKYKYVPMNKGQLEEGRGYWVYLTSDDSAIMTIKNASGTKVGETFAVSDLIFRNETCWRNNVDDLAARNGCEKTKDNAISACWIGQESEHPVTHAISCQLPISSWNYQKDEFDSENLLEVDSWKGYFMKSSRDDISVIRRSYQ